MYEVLFEKGFASDFSKMKLNKQAYEEIVNNFKLIAQNNPINGLNKLQGQKEPIFYGKFNFNNGEKFRVFAYINFENETINIIGISKRKNAYKNHEIKKLNARIIEKKQLTLQHLLSQNK